MGERSSQTFYAADVSITVAAIRRYPVKSMGGEALQRAELDMRGLVGDRRYAVVDAEGKLSSGKDSRRFRRRDEVFSYAAATGADGRVEVRRNGSGWYAGEGELDAELSEAFGDPVRVLAEADVPYFDDGPVSLVGTASLEWCRRELGVDADPRRTRTNLVLETMEPFEEEAWAGRTLEVGSVTLAVDRRLERCRMVDLAQDGVATTTPMLKALGRSRDVCLAMLVDVTAPGHLQVGDVVTVR
jgi:uncharacterized protein